jgi:hypothetical protein
MGFEMVVPQAQDFTQNASKYVSWANQLVVTNKMEYAHASDGLREIKELFAKADAVFDPVIKATNESHKKAVALKKQAVGPLDEAEAIAKGKVGTYLVQAEKSRKEAEAKAQAAADAEAKATGSVAPCVVVPKGEQAEGVSTRARWTFEVTDTARIKAEYLIPDVAKIKKIVAAMGPDAEAAVGGIKVRQDVSVVVRR